MSRDGKMVLRGFRQLAFYKMLTDTSGGRTYDNPMIAEAPISISGQEVFKQDALPAADDEYDTFAKPQAMDITITVGVKDLRLIAMLQGRSAPVFDGTTPNETGVSVRKASDQHPYVKIEGIVRYLGQDESGGSYHMIPLKAVLTGYSWAHGQDGYAIYTLNFHCIKSKYDEGLYEERQMETAVTLTETPDTAAPTYTASPLDDATDVAINVSPTLTWNKQMQFNAGDYTLIKKSNGAIIATTVTINGAGLVVTVNPDSDLENSTEYHLVISKNAKSAAGVNVTAATVVSFTTIAA